MREETTRARADFADFAMTSILRYAARVTRKTSQGKPSVAIVGAGSLASFLAPALAQAGYAVTEIITRGKSVAQGQSQARTRALAAKVGARAVTVPNAVLDAELVWFCVPDREISLAAAALARRMASMTGLRPSATRFAFHSSGALLSG